ncbi:uncharacterized protein YjiS (DUF1127 family) [Marivita geojedonensis]|nr:DUF1127 domain-containing protein [Marivita geojedonensis]PRY74688.1 uncharacterized protein YjiS (DUF1127 family) [Marivita geojedonensis]
MMSLMDTVFGRLYAPRHRSSVINRLNSAMALHRSRARLARLEPHLLDDIGLDAERAAEEASRPIWDAPSCWTK